MSQNIEGSGQKSNINETDVEIAGPNSVVKRAHSLFEGEAKYKDKKRARWEKILGLNKIEKKDIIQEYAEEFDEFVKEQTEKGISEIEALAKWHLLESPAVAASASGWGTNMDVDAFSKARDLWVKASDGELSHETINRWTEIHERAMATVLYRLRSFSHNANDFVEERNKWVNIGVLSMEEVNTHPLVKERAINDILWKVFGYSYTIRDFLTSRAQWVEAGVITEKEVNALPKVRERAISDIHVRVRGYPYDFNQFIARRDEWVSTGVLSLEDANSLPVVQETAMSEIRIKSRGYPYSKENYEEAVKKWVDAGIVDEKEARDWT